MILCNHDFQVHPSVNSTQTKITDSLSDINKTSLIQLWDNFQTTLRYLWDNFQTSWRKILTYFEKAFGTTLGQLLVQDHKVITKRLLAELASALWAAYGHFLYLYIWIFIVFPYSSLLLSFKGRIPSEKMAGLHIEARAAKALTEGEAFHGVAQKCLLVVSDPLEVASRTFPLISTSSLSLPRQGRLWPHWHQGWVKAII